MRLSWYQVTGSQGTCWTDDITPNRNMEVGAQHDMKNQAVALGANRIQLLSRNAVQLAVGTVGVGAGRGFGFGANEQTTVLHTGIAFRCPPEN